MLYTNEFYDEFYLIRDFSLRSKSINIQKVFEISKTDASAEDFNHGLEIKDVESYLPFKDINLLILNKDKNYITLISNKTKYFIVEPENQNGSYVKSLFNEIINHSGL